MTGTEIAIGKILETGLLGALLVLTGVGIILLFRKVDKLQEKRLDDVKEVWKEDVKFRAELKVLIQSILDLLRGRK